MNHPRRTIWQGKVVDLGIESVSPPDRDAFELEVVRHPGGAAILALNNDNQVCLIRQFRHAADGWIWELPAGKLDPGEAPAITAARELREEAGVEARQWVDLGFIWSTPGFCDERIYLYLATDLTSVPTDHQADELIEVHWYALDDAIAMAVDGHINDAKSVVGLLRGQAVTNTLTNTRE